MLLLLLLLPLSLSDARHPYQNFAFAACVKKGTIGSCRSGRMLFIRFDFVEEEVVEVVVVVVVEEEEEEEAQLFETEKTHLRTVNSQNLHK